VDRWSADLGLALAAFLFGSTFVVVKDAVADAGPIPFLGARFLVAAAVMWVVARRAPPDPGVTRAGVVCGLVLLAGYVFQTVGLQRTSATTSAFITYLLVVIVPVLSAVVLRRPPGLATIAGIAPAVCGLALLSGTGLRLRSGELLTVLCALAFAIHIVMLGAFAPRHDWRRLTAVQLTVVGLGCAVPGFVTGGYRFGAAAWVAAAYTAVAASAVAFGLMTWAQRRVSPSRTGLLLMLEPVFAALLAIRSGEHFGGRAAAGAALILAGVAVSEVSRGRTTRAAKFADN
jgi:drug/metabolite transporter (DMT)-like permease